MTTEKVYLKIPAIYGYEELASAVVFTWVRKFSNNQDKAGKTGLCVKEICLNAIEHGYQEDESKYIDIDFYQESYTLTIEIKDEGIGFEYPLLPILRPSPEKKRGWGLYTCFRYLDKIEFLSADKGSIIRLSVGINPNN
jgi:anti-sigma regulatory factor (Ser/Thr protein kinase)